MTRNQSHQPLGLDEDPQMDMAPPTQATYWAYRLRQMILVNTLRRMRLGG